MLYSLNFDLLSVGVAVAAIGIFGFVVFFNNRESSTTRAFLFLSLITIFWGIINYTACNSSLIITALWLMRLVMFFAVWQAFALFLFFYIFPNNHYTLSKLPVYISTAVTILVSFLTLTPYVFTGVDHFIPMTPPVGIVGPAMPFFGIMAIGLVIAGLVVFFARTIKSDKKSRRPFIIIWTGALMTFSLIIIFNFIFPSVFNDSSRVPLGAVFTFPFILFTAYAIIKHRLLNIRIIGTEVLTFALSLTILLEVLLTDSWPLIVFRFSLFILVVIFGVSLIRSAIKEVRQREELQKLTEELQSANLRLKELDQQKTDFLSIASHQLRTPLTIFKGFIELLQDGAYGKITKETNKVLKDFDTNNEHLIKLVDEFLNVSRIEQGRTKWEYANVDIGTLIGEVVHELQVKAKGKNMEVVWHGLSKPLSATVDREKIYQVVYNFVDNAIKYCDRGKINVNLAEENGGLSVRVKDQGVGFGKIDQANFFQKFYRGDNVKKSNVTGTGLGIYMCSKFIEGHNGKVWALSPGLGKGSEFGFWIPFDGQPKASTGTVVTE
ncbi:MAG: ATP-binding protein [Candidatus Magasanikbacteria bacterium]